MARRLDHPLVRRHRSKYPWDQWADGTPWEITRPDDYTVSDISMRNQLYNQAALRNMTIVAHLLTEGTIQFQFIERP